MDPESGRFLSKDTWAGSIQQPHSLHKYLYALDNPVNVTDASGKQPNWEDGPAILAIRDQLLDLARQYNVASPNLDDAAFAAMMATYLHAEGRMKGGDPGPLRRWTDPLGDIVAVIFGCWPLGMPRLGFRAGDTPSVGVANLRASVVSEILNNTIPGVEDHGFAYQGDHDLVQEYEDYLTVWRRNPFRSSQSAPLGFDQWTALQLADMDVSLGFLAANLQRGTIRAQQLPDIEPSAFNLLSWSRGGIQTERELRSNHAAGTDYANGHLKEIDEAFDLLGLQGRYLRYNDVDAQFLSSENQGLNQWGQH
jgi:hypothetical protein